MAFNIYKPKPKRGPKGVANLLETRNLAHVVNKAQTLSQIDAILQNVLPDNLAQHCHAMNIADGTLIIEVDSAAYVMQIRFCEKDLLYSIQQHSRINYIQRLDFRVRPASPAKSLPQKPLNTISTRSKQTILEATSEITDAELKAALLKLIH